MDRVISTFAILFWMDNSTFLPLFNFPHYCYELVGYFVLKAEGANTWTNTNGYDLETDPHLCLQQFSVQTEIEENIKFITL